MDEEPNETRSYREGRSDFLSDCLDRCMRRLLPVTRANRVLDFG